MKVTFHKLSDADKALPHDELLRKARTIVHQGLNEVRKNLGDAVVLSFQKQQRGGELRCIDDIAECAGEMYNVRCARMLNEISEMWLNHDEQ